MSGLEVNPELLLTKPTHIFNGVAVKVFTRDGQLTTTAEIMEGENTGKWTTIIVAELQPTLETKLANKKF